MYDLAKGFSGAAVFALGAAVFGGGVRVDMAAGCGAPHAIKSIIYPGIKPRNFVNGRLLFIAFSPFRTQKNAFIPDDDVLRAI
jgi:hypothetical protein